MPGAHRDHRAVAVDAAQTRFFDQRRPREIDEHPDVRQRVDLELLDHQAVFARGACPVNAVEAVAGDVFADARGVGRDELRPPPLGIAAGKHAHRQFEAC